MRFVLGCVDEGIGQDETAFGVSVEHLDGLAVVVADDVPRLLGCAAGHILS